MKLLQIAIIALMSMISTTMTATVVRVGLWQRPNGTVVLVLHDVHVSSKKESSQRDDIISHLKGASSSHLLAEDPCELGVPQEFLPSSFIPGIVANAKAQKITAESIEFRKGRCGLDREKLIAHTDFLYTKHSEISDHVPAQYKPSVEEIAHQLKKLKLVCPNEVLMSLSEQLEKIESELTDLVFLAKVENNFLQGNNLVVCVGADHGNFLVKAFKVFGYTHIKSIGDYNDEDLAGNIDTYALNLKDALSQLF